MLNHLTEENQSRCFRKHPLSEMHRRLLVRTVLFALSRQMRVNLAES